MQTAPPPSPPTQARPLLSPFLSSLPCPLSVKSVVSVSESSSHSSLARRPPRPPGPPGCSGLLVADELDDDAGIDVSSDVSAPAVAECLSFFRRKNALNRPTTDNTQRVSRDVTQRVNTTAMTSRSASAVTSGSSCSKTGEATAALTRFLLAAVGGALV